MEAMDKKGGISKQLETPPRRQGLIW